MCFGYQTKCKREQNHNESCCFPKAFYGGAQIIIYILMDFDLIWHLVSDLFPPINLGLKTFWQYPNSYFFSCFHVRVTVRICATWEEKKYISSLCYFNHVVSMQSKLAVYCLFLYCAPALIKAIASHLGMWSCDKPFSLICILLVVGNEVRWPASPSPHRSV